MIILSEKFYVWETAGFLPCIVTTKWAHLTGLAILFIAGLFFSFESIWAEGSRNVTPSNTGSASGSNRFVGYLQHDDATIFQQFLKPGASMAFSYTTNQIGIAAFIIEINGIPGYQVGTTDVLAFII
jgi:hypothetical protein